jgi:drug/metabolite transporter superfamily protein YnfA
MTGRSIALFCAAALAEIGGAYLAGAIFCLVEIGVIMYAPR